MKNNSQKKAEYFMENEKEFHLGFLPTEQSNPKTKTLEIDFKESVSKGVRTIQIPDRDVLIMAKRVLSSTLYKDMIENGLNTVKNGGRIIFSGCGATGRLSILLEAMWREYFAKNSSKINYSNSVASIMTGGDYALVKSVESFEDYQNFGRRQVDELNLSSKDMLVAITEGGETSSVIGTIKEAVERNAIVYMVFNNPSELLSENLVRCKEVINNPKVNVLDLFCGPMALAGSTRMQATTSEQLIVGSFIENIIAELEGYTKRDFAEDFAKVLDILESDNMVETISKHIEFEAKVYNNSGKITYLANDYLLDIFTDTTERSPTFMIPPFRAKGNTTLPMSWAFVKNPIYSTSETWEKILNRPLRCLSWQKSDYIAMKVPQEIVDNPPQIDKDSLFLFAVGNEEENERFENEYSAAVIVKVKNSSGNAMLEEASKSYKRIKELTIESFPEDTALHLMNHMLVKLVLNTISTGTMVCMNRVSGNWMSHVSISNKKLIDRAIRLISELSQSSYAESCYALFASQEELESTNFDGKEPPSPVQYTLNKMRK